MDPYASTDDPRGPTVGQGLDAFEFAWRAPQFAKEPWRSGAVFGRTSLGLRHSGAVLRGIAPLVGLDLVLSAGLAPRGRMGERVAGAVGGQTASLMAGVAGMALAGPAGAIVGAMLADPIGRYATEKGAGTLLRESHLMRSINTGGHYQDSQVAYTQRQRAAQELSTSLLNARQYLGQEAVLFHQ